jgi:uncharacterized protein YcbK (DUF882 family)
MHKTKDEDKQNKTHNTICVGRHNTEDQRRRQTNQKTQHNMCWTPPCTRQKTKTSKTKHTTQYVLDDTVHKIKDEDKQNKQYNKICVGDLHTKYKRRRQTKQKNTTQYEVDDTIQKTKDEDQQNKKHNTICAGRHHAQD